MVPGGLVPSTRHYVGWHCSDGSTPFFELVCGINPALATLGNRLGLEERCPLPAASWCVVHGHRPARSSLVASSRPGL